MIFCSQFPKTSCFIENHHILILHLYNYFIDILNQKSKLNFNIYIKKYSKIKKKKLMINFI